MSDVTGRDKGASRISQVEMPLVRFAAGIERVNRWLAGAVVALALAAVGLGAALIAGADDRSSQALEGVASPEVVGILDDNFAAWNAVGPDHPLGDVPYSRATVTEQLASGRPGVRATEKGAPVFLMPSKAGMERASEVVQVRDLAATTVTYRGGYAVMVFEFDDDLKFAHQWIVGSGR
ncbi:MAG TPA: hypothetical protein VJN50_01360 [Actinomycetota bacterium]|nr:hypothetical protein [Actinomycetota bacterium]